MEQQRDREKQEARRSVENMIKEAERGKAQIYKPPGKAEQLEMDDAHFHARNKSNVAPIQVL